MNEAEKLINRLYGNIGFTCDSCGRETNGITYVNGMKFCAKCYQETFGKDNQQNEIQQLKQQLEEKDKQIDIISRDNNSYKYNIDEQKRIIDDFAKQLKEKDKEIERLKDFIGCKGCVDVIKKSNEDQKQFAIQELEKVRDYAWFNYEKFRNYLNQQIKELKGEKDIED